MQNSGFAFSSYVGATARGISAGDADALLTYVLNNEETFKLVVENWNLLGPALRVTATRPVFWLFEACYTLQKRWRRSPAKPDFWEFLAGHLRSRTAYGDQPAEYLELPLDRCSAPATDVSKADGMLLASRCIEWAVLAQFHLPLVVDSSMNAMFCAAANNESSPDYSDPSETRFSSLITHPSSIGRNSRVLRTSIRSIIDMDVRDRRFDEVVSELRSLNVIETEIINQNDPLIAELTTHVLSDPKLTDVAVLIFTDRSRHDVFRTIVANLAYSGKSLGDLQRNAMQRPQTTPSHHAIAEAESIAKEWCYGSQLTIFSQRTLNRESASAMLLPLIKEVQLKTNASHVLVLIDSNSLWGDPAFEGIGAYAEAMQCVFRLADLSDGYSIVAFTGQQLGRWRVSARRSVAIASEVVSLEIQQADRVLSLDLMARRDLTMYVDCNAVCRGSGRSATADEESQLMSLAVTRGQSTRRSRKLFLEIDHARARARIARRKI